MKCDLAALVLFTGLMAGCAAEPRSKRTAAPPSLNPPAQPAPPSSKVAPDWTSTPENRPAAGAAAESTSGLVRDFVLPDVVSGVPFALSERRGRWQVLHFFPRADTPDCACDATAFTEHLWLFGTLGVDIACITSATETQAARYAHKYGLQAPLLPDPQLEITRQFGAFDPSRADPIVRTSVILGPDGRVRHRFDDVQGDDHVDELLRTLAELNGT